MIRVTFIAEKVGEVETEFKERIRSDLVRHGVRTAYLALASLREGDPEVALFIDVDAEAMTSLREDISRAFASMFSHNNSLAVVFLNHETNAPVPKEIPPFFQPTLS